MSSEEQQEEPVYFREDWELTWPIWHMLPHDERKALASKYGFHSIGEFEEYMTLRRAVGDSTEQEPYDNSLAYPPSRDEEECKKPAAVPKEHTKIDVQEDEDDFEEGAFKEDLLESSTHSDSALVEDQELYERAGYILMLPPEVIHKVLMWLPVDTYATLALVSPYWKSITRTELVYKRLCERLYLKQSRRRILNVARFGHSYRTMLERRPRVRAGGGLYVLKYTSIKKIQRDMWTEVPVGAILETVYYRYLYFQENGTVLYALTTDPPHEMIVRFLRMMITGMPDRAAVYGRYQVARHSVNVVAQQEWQFVQLQLSILPTSPQGKFGALTLDGHQSCPDGTFSDYRKVVEYKVPDEVFRFIKDRRL